MACALCLKEERICDSHVVPEFFSRRMKAGDTRSYLIGQGRARPKYLQAGIAEPMLCLRCEAIFQKAESWFSAWWYGGNRLAPPIPPAELELQDLDYEKIRILLLSILWRASVARGSTWTAADLGPHEERLRVRLLGEEPLGEFEYPTYGQLLVKPGTREVWDHAIMHPQRGRVQGLNCYRMLFGGAAWITLTSTHNRVELERYRIKPGGTLLLRVAPWSDIATSWRISDEVHRMEPEGFC